MAGVVANFRHAETNTDFRRVLYTSKHAQLVVMHLKPLEEIGSEVHDVDQYFIIFSGEGQVVVSGLAQSVTDNDILAIPAGVEHNLINTSSELPLKLITFYCPPHHADHTVHITKTSAEQDSEHFTGQTTEQL